METEIKREIFLLAVLPRICWSSVIWNQFSYPSLLLGEEVALIFDAGV